MRQGAGRLLRIGQYKFAASGCVNGEPCSRKDLRSNGALVSILVSSDSEFSLGLPDLPAMRGNAPVPEAAVEHRWAEHRCESASSAAAGARWKARECPRKDRTHD